MAKTIWGAYPADWDTFANMNLLGDLLPVVSNPKATISPHSKMQGVGKTPSHYNGLGHVAGLPQWTEKQATEKQVAKWKVEPDYGICIQTRNVRALDIDVDDADKARAITDFLQDALLYVPVRSRPNSGKCLLGFRVEGQLAKRMLRVDGGMVEFLGNGQQFIAAGTHPSGVRYEWDWGGASDFPVVSADVFEAVWEELVEKFGAGDDVRGGLNRKQGERVVTDDPTANALADMGLVLGEGKEGQLYIDCPWKDGHSSDTGIAQTTYFPKGTRGYEQGHFHCLHASCAHRGDGDFLEALGITAQQFDVIPAEEDERTGEEKMPMPALMRNNKGDILAITHNVIAVLERADITGIRLRFDTFRDEIMWSHYGKADWLPFQDEHNTELRQRFDMVGFKPVSKDMMRDCVHYVAVRCKFDSAIDWLRRLEWDGVPRVERFAADYLGTEDTAYTRAVSLYLWTALAGRVLEPGVQANMVPILVGPQGARKSTAVAALVPNPDFFTEISFHENDADLARRMRGRMVGEIAELQGLRTRELESIKAFVTRAYEDWVPKYKEFATSYARRIVFVGTSNDDQFLNDSTGNRRWLPMRTDECDSEAIKRDRLQLWAEGCHLFDLLGVDYMAAEKLARDEHDQFRAVDAWEDIIARWLGSEDMDGTANADADFLRNADILQGALNISADRMKRADEMRLASVMTVLGWERTRVSLGEERPRVWVKKKVEDS